MLSHAKHPQQLVAGGTNVAQRFDVKGKQRKEENMKKAVFDFIDTLASVLEPKFVYKIELQMQGFRQLFWSR